MRNSTLSLYRGNYGEYRSNGNAAVDINNSSDTKEPQPKSELLVMRTDIKPEEILEKIGMSPKIAWIKQTSRNYIRLPYRLNLLVNGHYDISEIEPNQLKIIVSCYLQLFRLDFNRSMTDLEVVEILKEILNSQLTDKKLHHAIYPKYQIDDGKGTDEELLERYLEEKRREGEDSQQIINRDEYLLTMSPKTCRVPGSRAITDTSKITNVTKPRLSLVSENNFNAAEEETEELEKIFSEKNIFSQTEPLSKQTNTETSGKPTDVQEKIKVKPFLKTGAKPDKRENIVAPVTKISRQKLVKQLRENLPEDINKPIKLQTRGTPHTKVKVRVKGCR